MTEGNCVGVADGGNPEEITLEPNEEIIKATYGKGRFFGYDSYRMNNILNIDNLLTIL